MPESLVWHCDININIFSLLKNYTKRTTPPWQCIGWWADADQLPISPQNTDWRNSPQQEYPITPYLEELSLIFHLQSHLMYYTYNCMNLTTIVIFTKFSTGFTPSYRYITKRERGIHTFNVWLCAILPRKLLQSTLGALIGVSTSHVFVASPQIV